MKEWKDQMHETIRLGKIPERIVSLVPSQTELLYDLGLGEKVVGITKFCIHPEEWFRTKSRVGGTKDISIEKVKKLAPDLLIGNKEENERSNIEELKVHFPVWMSDINTLDDALKMISEIGALTGTQERAKQISDTIQVGFNDLQQYVASKKVKTPLKVLYLIWRKPYIAAGKNTFIDNMLHLCGFENFSREERYPELKEENEQPDLIFLSSEPYPFKEKHIQELEEQYPNAKVLLVDGEMFSWYGSRLMQAPEYFIKLLTL